MRSIVLAGPGRIEIRERPAPAPGPGELLLAPVAVGLCRTDLELADGSMVYLRQGLATFPLTPGHEWVARVVGQGEGVLGFAPGDLVVGECSIGCSHCRLCLAGSYHQCPDRAETGILRQAGAMSGLLAFPARAAHRVPADVAVEDAVFAEPAAVALRAVRRADWRPGRSVLVVGAGTIGWLAAAIALDLHGADVAILDADPGRVGRAEAMGARRARADERFDIVIEASGHPAALQLALASLAPGGRLVVVGLFGQAQLPVDVDRALAFLLLGALFVLAYPRHFVLCAVLLVVGAGAIELLQLLSPSRHAHVEDAVIKAFGAVAGVLVGRLAARFFGLAQDDRAAQPAE